MAMTSLDSTRLAFLDVETTGLSPAMGDRIVEVGNVACQGEQESGHLSLLCEPEIGSYFTCVSVTASGREDRMAER